MPKGIKGFQKGHEVTKETREKISKAQIGRKMSEESRSKMIGRSAWNKGLTGEEYSKHYTEGHPKGMRGKSNKWGHHSEKTKDKIKEKMQENWKNPETKINMSLAHTKEKEFKGFRKSLRKRMMLMREYLEWRSAVFKRDNYHCQNCGNKGYVEAHHIISFSKLLKIYNINTTDDARKCKILWDVGNGITYCNKCHILLDENRGRGKIKSDLHIEMQKGI